ncbi:Uncharacterised protein [Chlamydia abortus]|nr:Uncharacterised protein [Chlamydia abortus]SGA22512.1 Uncharacterised protein [Chlamydia abortus]
MLSFPPLPSSQGICQWAERCFHGFPPPTLLLFSPSKFLERSNQQNPVVHIATSSERAFHYQYRSGIFPKAA